ncbi:MAG: hypothetical protein ABI831_12780 [Betaproteobacteria bacterium]
MPRPLRGPGILSAAQYARNTINAAQSLLVAVAPDDSTNYELREDGTRELREDGTFELRED